MARTRKNQNATGHKICTRCKLDKPMSEFRPSRNPSGFHSWCRDCSNEATKLYRKNNYDLLTEKKHKYRAEHGREENNRRKWVYSTDAEYRELKKKQRNEWVRNNPEKFTLTVYRNAAKRMGRVFDLTLEDVTKLLNSPCYYCDSRNKIGIDRVDNSIGYILSNVVPCCTTHNLMKRVMTQEEFIEACRAVVRKFGLQ